MNNLFKRMFSRSSKPSNFKWRYREGRRSSKMAQKCFWRRLLLRNSKQWRKRTSYG